MLSIIKNWGNSASSSSPQKSRHDSSTFNEAQLPYSNVHDDDSSVEEAEIFYGQDDQKFINILLLGETGVGKSTWINGLANYLTYDTLSEAEKNEPTCLIPSQFSITDVNYDAQIVKLGDSSNECFEAGASSTQIPICYTIALDEKKSLRIIDTPGIGDTRGAEKDSENLTNILSHISQYQELHGICILLKPNSSRLTVLFKYCINELLTHLHKTAAKNIVFCFTNARSTFYAPGDTITPLKKLLNDLKNAQGVEIPLCKETIYCVDNEAFRLLCCLHNKVDFGKDERPNYCKSWEKSAVEMRRLIQRFEEIPAHSVQETISLNEARRIILTLAKPLADISQNIQDNINVLEDHKQALKKVTKNDKDLQQKLMIPEVGLKLEQLGYPRTVCTAAKCIETKRLKNTENSYQTIYKTTCHDHCFLENVIPDKVPAVELQRCFAMDETTYKCNVCQCPWDVHMHVTYTQIQTSKMIEDKDIQKSIKDNKSDAEIQQLAISKSEARVRAYQEEQRKIDQICARFGAFLKAHAIMPYNDAIEDYITMNIGEAERVSSLVDNRQKIQLLKQQLAEYQEEKRILDQRLKTKSEKVVAASEIKLLQRELQSLRLSGPTLKKLFDATVSGHKSNFKFNEQRFNPNKYRKKREPEVAEILPVDNVPYEKEQENAFPSIDTKAENQKLEETGHINIPNASLQNGFDESFFTPPAKSDMDLFRTTT